jgi:hypothetical protein
VLHLDLSSKTTIPIKIVHIKAYPKIVEHRIGTILCPSSAAWFLVPMAIFKNNSIRVVTAAPDALHCSQ